MITTLDVVILIMLWNVVGYLVVRYVHQKIESLPNTFVGIVAVIAWPLVAFLVAVILLSTSSGKATLFGKGKL